jgi:hypothetical protein
VQAEHALASVLAAHVPASRAQRATSEMREDFLLCLRLTSFLRFLISLRSLVGTPWMRNG